MENSPCVLVEDRVGAGATGRPAETRAQASVAVVCAVALGRGETRASLGLLCLGNVFALWSKRLMPVYLLSFPFLQPPVFHRRRQLFLTERRTVGPSAASETPRELCASQVSHSHLAVFKTVFGQEQKITTLKENQISPLVLKCPAEAGRSQAAQKG